MDDFEIFWRAYPRRVAKAVARKAWMQTAKIRPPLEELLAAINNQCQSEQWQKDGGQYIPHPATWLRGERWSDEMEINVPKQLSKTLNTIVALESWKRELAEK
jgi:2'-5' RNA ligase